MKTVGPMRSARFEIIALQSDLVVLVDVGPWDKYPTITNDAEGVIARLAEEGGGMQGRRVIYFDSEGEPGELHHNGRRFVGFGPILRDDPLGDRLKGIRSGRRRS